MAERFLSLRMFLAELRKGCSDFTQQRDPGTGKVLDLCEAGGVKRGECSHFGGLYQTRGQTEPVGSSFDTPIGEGTIVGFCEMPKNVARIGPVVLFDRTWFDRFK
jgi:hypothetical protein